MRYSGPALVAIGTFLSLAATAAEAQTRQGSNNRISRENFRPPVMYFENRAGSFRPEYFSGSAARNFRRPTLYFENRAGNFRPEYFPGQSFRRGSIGPRIAGPRAVSVNRVDPRRFRPRGQVVVNNFYPGYTYYPSYSYYPPTTSGPNYQVTPLYAEPRPRVVTAQNTPVSPPKWIKVGSICSTPDKICKLDNAGAVGDECSCGSGASFQGTIRR